MEHFVTSTHSPVIKTHFVCMKGLIEGPCGCVLGGKIATGNVGGNVGPVPLPRNIIVTVVAAAMRVCEHTGISATQTSCL